MFPRALVACINEGRSPQLHEIEELATRVLCEAFSVRSDDRAYEAALKVADAALNGGALAASPTPTIDSNAGLTGAAAGPA
jgi:hypothetical protein